MTLATTNSRITYQGTGTSGPFVFPFRVFAASDLKVTKRSTSGAETLLAYPLDYSVAGVGDATGSVSTTLPVAANEFIVIRRDQPRTQAISIRNQGTYFPGTIEDELDRLVMIDQAQQDLIDRCLKLSETSDPAAFNLTLPSPDLGKVLVGTGSGWSTASLDSSAVAVPGGGRTVGTLSAYLLNNAVKNIKDFGAVADGATHPLSAFFASLAAAQVVYPHATSLTNEIDWAASVAAVTAASNAGGGFVFAPRGTYLQSATVPVPNPDVVLIGEGWASVFKSTLATFNIVTPASTAHRFKALNLRFRGSAVDNTTTQFAIFTGALAAPDDCEVASCYFGETSTAGASLNSGVKIDGGNRWKVHSSTFSYLWGSISNTGYGVLAGTSAKFQGFGNHFEGAVGRGRHAIYLSGGCTNANVHNNTVNAFNEEAFPIYSQGAQPASTDNHIHHNTILNGGQLTATGAAISIFGTASDNVIDYNLIVGYQGFGITVNNSGLADSTKTARNVVAHNRIRGVSWDGISSVGTSETLIHGNNIRDCSQASLGTYPAIGVRSDGATVSDNTRILENKCYGVTSLRCGVQIDAGSTNTTMSNNHMPHGLVAKVITNGCKVRGGDTNDFGLAAISGNNGDANVTVQFNRDAAVEQFASPLTANRTVTIDMTNAMAGQRMKFLRTGLGAFTLDVGGLKTIPAGTAAVVEVEADDSTPPVAKLVGYAPL